MAGRGGVFRVAGGALVSLFVLFAVLVSTVAPAFAHGDVTVAVSGAPDPVERGASLTFTIVVGKTGGETYTEVDDTLNITTPQGSTFESLPDPAGWSCSKPAVGTGGDITCTATGVVILGDSTFVLVQNSGFDGAATRTLSAQFTASSLIDPDPDTSNNTGSATVAVSDTSTATTLVSTPSPSVAGQSVRLTATVTASGNPVVGGSVEFFDGVAPLGKDTTDSNGEASLDVTALAIGAHSLTAVLEAGSGFVGSTSPAVDHTVKALVTVTVAPTPNPAVIGQSVNFVATLSIVAPGQGTPTGTVDFLIDGSSPISVPISGNTVVIDEVPNGTGTHNVQAVYSGDANFDEATSPPLNLLVNKAATTTTVTTAPNPSDFGETVRLTATVGIDPPGALQDDELAAGNVIFSIDGVDQQPSVAACPCGAILDVSTLTPGSHRIGARFTGSVYYEVSTATEVTHVVNDIPTATEVTAPSVDPVYDDPVEFQVTVTPDQNGPATGSVTLTLFDGTNTIDETETLAGGTATFSFASLNPGPYLVSASYAAQDGFAASEHQTFFFYIPDTPDISFTSSPSPSYYGQDVTFDITLRATNSQAVPTGEVLVNYDPPGLPLSNGVASFSRTDLPVGQNNLIVTYEGDPHFFGNLAYLTHEVLPDTTTTTVTSSDETSFPGQDVTFTITVASTYSGESPGGNVTLSGLPGGARTLPLTNGSATFTPDDLPIGTYTVSADFAAQGNFAASTGAVNQTVAKAATTATLSAIPGSGAYGTTIRLSADIAQAAGAAAPTGDVTYSAGAVTLGMAPVGTPLDLSSLEPGTYTVVADYPGDSVYEPATSNTQTVTISQDTPVLVVESSMPVSSYGQQVTFTVTVTATVAGTPPLSGTVSLSIDNTARALTLSGGTASVDISDLPVGAHTVVASWAGDTRYAAASSDAITQTVDELATSIAGTANAPVFGDDVLITARVTSQFESQVPRGTVTFSVGASSVVATLDNTGEAVVNLGALPAGVYQVTLSYTPETGSPFGATDPISVRFEVLKDDVTLTVEADPPNPVLGTAVTYTVTAVADNSASIPTGLVTFLVNGPAVNAQNLVNGAGSLATFATAAGTNSIVVNYNGDLNFNSATAGTTTNVGAANTQTVLVSSLNPSQAEDAVTFAANVSSQGGTPDGNVIFTVDGIAESPVTLSAGRASITTETLSPGSHTITAQYQGTANYTGSTSNTIVQDVGLRPTTTTLSQDLTSTLVGEPVTFTATVTTPGATPGTVDFLEGSTVIGTAPVSGTTAVLQISTLSVGTHNGIFARYSGDAQTLGSDSSPLAHTVNKRDSVLTVSATPSTIVYGQSVVLGGSVAQPPGAPAPTGTVTYYEEFTTLGTATLGSTVTASNLFGGARTISATYSGDENYNQGSGTAAVQVNQEIVDLVLSVSPTEAALDGSMIASVTATLRSTGLPYSGGVLIFIDSALRHSLTVVDGSGSTELGGLMLPGPHTITAGLRGYTNFADTDSNAVDVNVLGYTTATTISSSGSPSLPGADVTFTARVSHTVFIPPGAVTFTIDGATTAPVSLDSGVATFTTNALAIGDHTVTANYTGFSTFAASASEPLTQRVEPEAVPTTTTLVSSANPSIVGEPASFTATVAATAGGQTPQGNVVFNVDGSDQAAVALSNGQATFTTSALSVGAHDVIATYSGAVGFAFSASPALTQQVDVHPTTLVLTSSLNPSIVGQDVTFTIEVTSPNGKPDGDARLTIGSIQRTAALSNGRASFTISGLQSDIHVVIGEYLGSPLYAGNSEIINQTVLPHPTTASLASSQNPSEIGQDVTFTATLTSAGGTPTGELTFFVDGTRAATVALSGGQAALSTSMLVAGEHEVEAVYEGEGNFDFAAATLTQTVNPHATTTALISSQNPSAAGQAVTFTATVTSAAGTPAGSVVFIIDGTAGTPVALAGGQATYTTSSLTPGQHTVVASYAASGNFDASTSPTLTQTVDTIATTTALISSQNPSAAGQAVIFTATVTSAAGTPTGSVVFIIDGTAGTPVALAGGQATFNTSTLAPGQHTVVASYTASGEFDASTSPTLTQTVDLIPTTTTLVSSSNPSPVGAVEFTATVSSGTGQPGGGVVFNVDGVAQSPITLADGQAIFAATLEVGTHTITATYAGNAGFAPSTSSALTQVVDLNGTTTTLTSALNPTSPFDEVLFNAVVTSSSGVPTGTVVFTVDGVARPPAELSDGRAFLLSPPLTVGPHNVSAAYSGSASHGQSVSQVLVQQVAKMATMTDVDASPNGSFPGEAVTFTARVLGDGVHFPPGVVTFLIDGVAQPPAPLSQGRARLTYTFATVGQHVIDARYDGSENFEPSAGTFLQTVNPNTTTELASSHNPGFVGESVTFTATILSQQGQADGGVTFVIDGVAQPVIPTSNSRAEFTTATLAEGEHTVVATFFADRSFGPSTSETLVQRIQVRPTEVSLYSSENPSSLGQEVVFTATVGTATGFATGQVTFSIDGVAQPPVTLSGGVATFATSSLTAGSHAIVAVYGGSATHAASTSETLTQTVNDSGDSEKLRELQVQMTKMVAQASGQAISGAIDGAVSDGFSDSGGQLMEGSAGMLGFSLVPPQEVKEETAESALDGLAGEGKLADRARAASNTMLGYGDKPLAVSMPNVGEQDSQKWRLWAKIHNTAWNAKPEKADIEGNQINVLAGVGYRLTPNLIIGAFGGYETFDYTSAPLNGRLEGDGWTVGGYLGWKITPSLRFDAGFARSELSYDASAGAAAGAFGGERWLLQSGLTGTHTMNGFEIEPSARIYALWENEDAYTDSLGAFHDMRSFSTARASGGVKVTYPFEGDGYVISPYLGVYADYYFSKDDASTDLTFEDAIQDGWSARLTAGFGLNLDGGAQLSIGGELGGLGEGGAPHGTVKASVRIPF